MKVRKSVLVTTFSILIVATIALIVLGMVDASLNWNGVGLTEATTQTLGRLGRSFDFGSWFTEGYPLISSSLTVVLLLVCSLLFIVWLAVSIVYRKYAGIAYSVVFAIFAGAVALYVVNYRDVNYPALLDGSLYGYFMLVAVVIGSITSIVLLVLSTVSMFLKPNIIRVPVAEEPVEEMKVVEVIMEEPKPEPVAEETTIVINNYYGEKKEEPVADYVEEEEPVEVVEEEPVLFVASEEGSKTPPRESFAEKLKKSDKVLKDAYNELKAEFLSWGLNSRISKGGDSFRRHCKTYARITVSGKNLKIYYALDPMAYVDTTIPYKDSSEKKIYEEIPFTFKVKSALSIKRAKMLIEDAVKEEGFVQEQPVVKNYSREAIKTIGQEKED